LLAGRDTTLAALLRQRREPVQHHFGTLDALVGTGVVGGQVHGGDVAVAWLAQRAANALLSLARPSSEVTIRAVRLFSASTLPDENGSGSCRLPRVRIPQSLSAS
jgi:hypothetical protein